MRQVARGCEGPDRSPLRGLQAQDAELRPADRTAATLVLWVRQGARGGAQPDKEALRGLQPQGTDLRSAWRWAAALVRCMCQEPRRRPQYAVPPPAGVRRLPSWAASHLRPAFRVATALVRHVCEGARRCARPDVQALRRVRPQAIELWHSQRGATAAALVRRVCEGARWCSRPDVQALRRLRSHTAELRPSRRRAAATLVQRVRHSTRRSSKRDDAQAPHADCECRRPRRPLARHSAEGWAWSQRRLPEADPGVDPAAAVRTSARAPRCQRGPRAVRKASVRAIALGRRSRKLSKQAIAHHSDHVMGPQPHARAPREPLKLRGGSAALGLARAHVLLVGDMSRLLT